MTGIAFFVIIASLVFLVVGTEDMGSGHMVFANRAFSGHGTFTNKGINVQTETNQDQGCEGAGGTSGITNACTATSTPGSTPGSIQTQVILNFVGFRHSASATGGFNLLIPTSPNFCNNIGCQSIHCTGDTIVDVGDCTSDNGVQLGSACTVSFSFQVTCPRTETHTIPGTGITQSGGVSGG